MIPVPAAPQATRRRRAARAPRVFYRTVLAYLRVPSPTSMSCTTVGAAGSTQRNTGAPPSQARKTIRPSGVQLGRPSSPDRVVNRLIAPPARSCTYSSVSPSRVDANTSRWPALFHAGSTSAKSPPTSSAGVPGAAVVYTSALPLVDDTNDRRPSARHAGADSTEPGCVNDTDGCVAEAPVAVDTQTRP